MKKAKVRNIITDKLVSEKTGKTIAQWFNVLDKKGATKMSQQDIFGTVSGIEGLKILGHWNQHLPATSYQWKRGLRLRDQHEKGFEIRISKTVNVPVKALYEAWLNPRLRETWLQGENISIRKATLNKSARITWSDGVTGLSVDFYSKSKGKSQVVVQHKKLGNPAKAEEMKNYWSKSLNKLKVLLESIHFN